jgi:hypothetical protein
VKFPTPPEPEKVKSEPPNSLKSLHISHTKDLNTKEREKKETPAAPVSLSPQESAGAPGDAAISPEVMRKLGLRYNVADWPPKRRED